MFKKELVDGSRDVIVYFVNYDIAGNGFAIVNGKVDLERSIQNTNGRGLIVMATGSHVDLQMADYLEIYARTLMHEQCHLYGLKHVPIPNTLMFPCGNYGSKQLDKDSKIQLLDALE